MLPHSLITVVGQEISIGINNAMVLSNVLTLTERQLKCLLFGAKRAFWSAQWYGFSIYLLYIIMFQAVRRAVNVLNVTPIQSMM